MRLTSARTTSRATLFTLAIFAMLVSGCRDVQQRAYRPPTVVFRNVVVEGIGLTGGSLRVALLVRNPNFYPLSTAAMRYQALRRRRRLDPNRVRRRLDASARRVERLCGRRASRPGELEGASDRRAHDGRDGSGAVSNRRNHHARHAGRNPRHRRQPARTVRAIAALSDFTEYLIA